MTREEALKELDEANTFDTEGGHIAADEVLCKLLISLGYQDVVDKYNQNTKWYA